MRVLRHVFAVLALLPLLVLGIGCDGLDLSKFKVTEKYYVHYPVGDYALDTTLVSRFNSIRSSSAEKEDFIFFTDPHLLMVGDLDVFERCDTFMRAVKNYFTEIKDIHVICGGDWLGSKDTPTEAIEKLQYCNSLTYRYFGNAYHAVVGNHDTNYQGNSEEGVELGGEITAEQYCGAYLSHIGSNYYAFTGQSTRFYMLDTYIDWNHSLTPYRLEQAKWLAENLKKDDARNSAIVMHIYFIDGNGAPATFAAEFTKVITAYNAHSVAEVDGVAYDFTACSGRVRFVSCGHVHKDMESSLPDGTPVFSTVDMRNGNEPDFDLVSVDYEHNVINMVRVGRGVDRTLQMPR